MSLTNFNAVVAFVNKKEEFLFDFFYFFSFRVKSIMSGV